MSCLPRRKYPRSKSLIIPPESVAILWIRRCRRTRLIMERSEWSLNSTPCASATCTCVAFIMSEKLTSPNGLRSTGSIIERKNAVNCLSSIPIASPIAGPYVAMMCAVTSSQAASSPRTAASIRQRNQCVSSSNRPTIPQSMTPIRPSLRRRRLPAWMSP